MVSTLLFDKIEWMLKQMLKLFALGLSQQIISCQK